MTKVDEEQCLSYKPNRHGKNQGCKDIARKNFGFMNSTNGTPELWKLFKFISEYSNYSIHIVFPQKASLV